MPKYTVKIQVQVPAYTDYEVEADSQEEANVLGCLKLNSNDFWSSSLWLNNEWKCEWEEAYSPRVLYW